MIFLGIAFQNFDIWTFISRERSTFEKNKYAVAHPWTIGYQTVYNMARMFLHLGEHSTHGIYYIIFLGTGFQNFEFGYLFVANGVL